MFQISKYFCNRIYIVYNLKIKHPDTNKISSVFKSITETIFWFDGSCSEYFKCKPGFIDTFHVFYCLKRKEIPHILMESVMLRRSCPNYTVFNTIFNRMS